MRALLPLVCITAALAMGTVRAAALDLAFPAPATLTKSEHVAMTSHSLPVGPFAQGAISSALIEAPMSRAAYRIALAPSVTTLDLIAPLRSQVRDAGFDIAFECSAQQCGGFDFRFGLDVLPEPDMHVDLGDFRYLYAQRGAGGDTLALVVSRSPSFGFVHITKLGNFARPDPSLVQATKSPETDSTAGLDIAAQLQRGPIVLAGLTFTPSSPDVQVQSGALEGLAQWLAADPARVITLIGYTDTSGKADDNLALSLQRATSLRTWILGQYAIAPAQIIAQGRGAEAPIAPNDTAEGRAQNRRIEAVLPN